MGVAQLLIKFTDNENVVTKRCFTTEARRARCFTEVFQGAKSYPCALSQVLLCSEGCSTRKTVYYLKQSATENNRLHSYLSKPKNILRAPLRPQCLRGG
jgi:hypothetical protein